MIVLLAWYVNANYNTFFFCDRCVAASHIVKQTKRNTKKSCFCCRRYTFLLLLPHYLRKCEARAKNKIRKIILYTQHSCREPKRNIKTHRELGREREREGASERKISKKPHSRTFFMTFRLILLLLQFCKWVAEAFYFFACVWRWRLPSRVN